MQLQIKKVLDNNYVRLPIIVILVLYCSLLDPELPPVVKNLFNNTLFRIVVLFGVVVLAHEDPVIALMISVAFVITLDYVNRKTKENMVNHNCVLSNEDEEVNPEEPEDEPKDESEINGLMDESYSSV